MDGMELFEKGMKKLNADIEEMLWGKAPEAVEAVDLDEKETESEESKESEKPKEGE